MFRTLISLAAASFAVSSISGELSAQDRDVVFLHGFQGSSTHWQSTATSLSTSLAIRPLRATTGWSSVMTTQGTTLSSYLISATTQANLPAVAHSNGGLVGRQYVRAVSAEKLGSMLTIGTPHRGVRLVDNAGTAVIYLSNFTQAIFEPIDLYTTYDPDVLGIFGHPVQYLANGGYAFAQVVGLIGTALQVGAVPVFASSVPVLNDDRTTSTFITGLNASSNLTLEASRLGSRVSLSTEVSPEGALIRLFVGQSASNAIQSARRALEYLALFAYFYYSSHNDPVLRNNAWMWDRMWWYLFYMDVEILNLQGALSHREQLSWVSHRMDGLLPETSTIWPGATQHLRLLQEQNGQISHIEQHVNPLVITRIREFLQQQGIVTRSGGGPGGCTPVPPAISC